MDRRPFGTDETGATECMSLGCGVVFWLPDASVCQGIEPAPPCPMSSRARMPFSFVRVCVSSCLSWSTFSGIGGGGTGRAAGRSGLVGPGSSLTPCDVT